MGGVLEEVALDYFAQDDAGTVYYLGEDVDEYDEHGQLAKHNPPDDAWLAGKDTPAPGVIMPAHPKVGDKFKSEDVSATVDESDEVVALDASMTVPAGTFEHCLKMKETLGDGTVEFKLYAPGVGVVRETPATGDELLISHTTQSQAEEAKPAAEASAVSAVYSEQETADFKKLAKATMEALDVGKETEMVAKLTDLETAWDDQEKMLRPKNEATWVSLDKTLDKAISALRSSHKNTKKGKAALEELVKNLELATKH